MTTAQGTIFHKDIGKRPPTGGVRQDNGACYSARTKQRYPAAVMHHDRAETQTTKPPTSGPRQKMTFWVEPKAAAELRRKARESHLSVSAVGASFIEQMVGQDIQQQYAALLQPMVEQAIRKQMNRLVTFLVSLLIPMYCNTGQTKRLVVNIIGRLHDNPQMSEQVLNTILDESSQAARNDLKRRSPHLASLIQEEIDRLLSEDETA